MNQFTVKTDVCKVDDKLGLVFGYAMVSKIEGEPYFDLQGHHIPEDVMLKMLTDFMVDYNVAKDMHSGDQVGKYVFAFPLTEDIAKSLDIEAKKTGALVAMKPDSDELLQKFVSGEYTGFSIGGTDAIFEEVNDEKDDP